jgi:phage tail-like protein
MTATVTTSLSSIRTDPIRSFKFLVNIYNPTGSGRKSLAGKNGLGFMTVSGLNFQTDIIPYRQGGYNTTPQKMPGQTDFSPLSLSRGALVGTSQAWDWNRQMFTVLQGTGTGGPGDDFRGTTDVQVLDHPVTSTTNIPIKLWIRLYRTWPSGIAYSDLDAGGNGFMVESMTMAHEGFIMAWAANTPGADVPASAIKAA